MPSTVSKSRKKPQDSPPIEQIEIKYMPVKDAVLFDKNPKKHSIGDIAASIQRYGFRNPPLWDASLNDGQGGIVAGNGRTETLRSMELQNQPVPRGIAIDADGNWCMPIVFGCDAPSEVEAQAYAIDDNNLTMSGGDFTHWDMAKMWDRDDYLQLLTSIAEEEVTPITVDEDAIGALLAGMDDGYDSESAERESSTKEINPDDFEMTHTCPKCGFEFDGKK